jgi:hypothetical protein
MPEAVWYVFGTPLSAMRGERVKGIEPSCVAWKATVLPLNYTRAEFKMVRRFLVKGNPRAVLGV